MYDEVGGWPDALLAEVYAELTGRTVVVDEEETTGFVPTIVGVDDRGRYVLVKLRVPRSTSRVETVSANVSREDLVAETRERELIRVEE